MNQNTTTQSVKVHAHPILRIDLEELRFLTGEPDEVSVGKALQCLANLQQTEVQSWLWMTTSARRFHRFTARKVPQEQHWSEGELMTFDLSPEDYEALNQCQLYTIGRANAMDCIHFAVHLYRRLKDGNKVGSWKPRSGRLSRAYGRCLGYFHPAKELGMASPVPMKFES